MTKLLTRPQAPARRPRRSMPLTPPMPRTLSPQGGRPPLTRLIVGLRPQSRAVITGTVRTPRTVTVGSGQAYSFTLVDGTGELDVLFLGWPTIRGLLPGTRVTVEGRVGTRDGKLTLWNPRYRIEPAG